MQMKRSITHKYDLTKDDVKVAILSYIGRVKEWPVPTVYDAATVTIDDGGAVVWFSEDVTE